jgi:hypothetical protein
MVGEAGPGLRKGVATVPDRRMCIGLGSELRLSTGSGLAVVAVTGPGLSLSTLADPRLNNYSPEVGP